MPEDELAPSARPPPRDKTEDHAKYKRRARKRYPKEPRAVSLLRLPDELVLRVFELYWNDFRDDIRMLPVEPLCLNKRILALIRPLWHRKLDAPLNADLFMTSLLRRTGIHPFVQDFTIELNTESIEMHCLVMAQLHNLQNLKVDLSEWQETTSLGSVPAAFMELLSELPLLRRLDLVTTSINQDFALYLLSDKAPPLQHITCHGSAIDNDVLGALEIRSLTIHETPDNVILPFLDLERLSLTSSNFNKQTYEKLLKSIKDETDRGERPLKLRRLELDLACQDPVTLKQISLHTFYDHLLWTLRKSPLYMLDIALYEPFSTLFQGYTLPSVRGLSLTANCSLPDKENLSVLGSFVSLFPNLTQFKLCNLKIATTFPPDKSDGKALGKYVASDAANRALLYPHFTALLVFLQSTQVLDFRLVGHREEIRWTRPNSARGARFEDPAMWTF